MSDTLVKTIREKTEEADLETILKPTLGGFSRKSVRDYVSMMRQQQYDMQQSFAEEAQHAQAERDRLARELAEAAERTADLEDRLSEAIPLAEKAAALEADMEEAVQRIQADAALLEQLHSERDDLLARIKQQDDALCALSDELAQRAPAPAASPSKEAAPSDAAVQSEQPDTLQIQLAILTREQETAARQLESVIHQETLLFQALEECRAELECRREQTLCLEAENEELSRRLSDQMQQNIVLNREITHIKTTNETLRRKLEHAQNAEAVPALPGEI